MREPNFLHQSGSPTAAKNRRKSPRHPSPVTHVTVVAGDAKRQAAVLDESSDGIGILIPGPVAVAAGQEIELVYQGVPARGVVRWVQAQDGDEHRAGIQWLRSERNVHGMKPHANILPPLDAVDAVFHELNQLLGET
jgi:hypothetical protein